MSEKCSEEKAPTPFRTCCKNVIQVLRKIGVPTPELDARLLISNALGLRGAAFFLEPDRLLSENELAEIAQCLARRMAGEPVSRIVGSRGFWKSDFDLSSDVLDPRPDSETLIEVALDLMAGEYNKKVKQGEKLRILDLGTGSGALLLSMLLEFPQAVGIGIDISEDALRVARANAMRLECHTRAQFLAQNWLDGLSDGTAEPFDLIICNPPYIPSQDIENLAPDVRDFDPPLALDGGADGLVPYREVIPQLPGVLSPHGIALFEIGEGQHKDVTKLFNSAGLYSVGGVEGAYKDLAGIFRALAFSPTKGL